MDLLYIGIGGVFFLLTWGLVRLCETLAMEKPGERT
jgi:hypothetical protein